MRRLRNRPIGCFVPHKTFRTKSPPNSSLISADKKIHQPTIADLFPRVYSMRPSPTFHSVSKRMSFRCPTQWWSSVQIHGKWVHGKDVLRSSETRCNRHYQFRCPLSPVASSQIFELQALQEDYSIHRLFTDLRIFKR